MKAIKQIESPCEMPNGLQWTDEGLFVMDQKTDNVYVVDETGRLLRTINTPTANGSGITVGGGYLWTASNGESASRPARSTDTGLGYIYKLDLQTGEAVDRFRTPDGGGIHGIEWDGGKMWITAFNPLAIFLVDPSEGVQNRSQVRSATPPPARFGPRGRWAVVRAHDRQRNCEV
jgi:sugar lactone lactonase YvrE